LSYRRQPDNINTNITMKLNLSWQKLGAAELERPSVIFLLLANLVPLYGVLFLRWEIFPLLVLFWLENVIVGVFNVFKMILASPAQPVTWLAKVAAIPFFCIHYGLFTMVHGIFVFAVFGGIFTGDPSFPDTGTVVQTLGEFQIGWAVLALLLSHFISFTVNYIGKGEYKQSSLNELMQQPYGRVVVLHVTILAGGFLIGFLGSPVIALVLLIALKSVIDVQAHLKEHAKFRAPAGAPAG
jgi:hypothetical protein